MESIGKVVLMPKGTYSAGTTYSHLDWVRYNSKSWVCKQDNVIGVTPSEGATWTVLAEDGQGGGGQGVPAGGTTGQVLAKASNTDYDTEWVNGGGGGGDCVAEELVKDTVGWTGKNLLKIPSDVITETVSDVTFTITRNSDGQIVSINANGTASADIAFWLLGNGWGYADCVDIPKGIEANKSYTLTDSLATHSASKYIRLVLKNSSGTNVYALRSDNAPTNTTPADLSGLKISAWISISNGTALSNEKFYPMLRHGDITDSTYEPYHETVDFCKFDRSEQAVLGAKNLLENTATTQEINGVTFTVNTDGTVGVNGTASATTVLPIATNVTTGNRDLIMSGCPAGGSSNGYSLKWRMSGSDIYDYGEGVDIPANSSTALSVEIRINNGYNASNLLFKPMLRLASDPDNTYAPYAMTNKQLTDAVENISVDDVTNSTATFSQAGSRANLVSGEKMSVLFGKIMKWFADLKDLAFIAKDGVSSTKYLRGDGTWQTFPTIPTVDQTYGASSTNAQSGTAVAGAISGKQDADDKMTSADMTDVLTPLPSARGNWQEYSTTEKRVGTWVDGKPLYQKTYYFASPTTDTLLENNVAYAHLVAKSYVTAGTDMNTDDFYYSSSSYVNIRGYVRSNSLKLSVFKTSSPAVSELYITFQYTKTTD